MKKTKNTQARIVVKKNGPYEVSGGLPLAKEIIETDDKGNSISYIRGETYPAKTDCSLCRCGASECKPYCDGTHKKIAFDGTETASQKKYIDMAERISGLAMDLTDAEDLCAYARFCHNKTGRVWDLTERSDDPKLKAEAIKQSGNCPAGRLVAWEKNAATPIEPRLKPSLGLIEDPQKKVSGPLWAKGGIEIVSADGKTYERRNRVTLCRCGQSKNKPFCDGCHASAGFNDGDASLK